ncbi:DUF1566 domain-containing protein [Bacteroides sp.]|uniref:Lcl domain-containing protein n=1 Tax=Bacteroides sp. TaxID=29523 RepID=UPI002622A6CB|nr:DUF1566 domain-containing protein [Bacteroides sp.]MDD3038674.1 DUF1566 domain-containing protein [Bacteroides sp.]
MKLYGYLIGLSLLVTVSGCNKEELPYYEPSGDAIAFHDGDSWTRAAVKTSFAEGDKIGVFGYYLPSGTWSANSSNTAPNFMYNKAMTAATNGKDFTYSPTMYWPADTDASLSFFAYYPFTDNNGITVSDQTTTGAPTLTYTVNPDVTKQVDLLTSKPLTDRKKADGAIAFEFKHALTRVSISGKLADTSMDQVVITSVKLTSAKSTAIYNYSTNLWNVQNGSAEYTAFTGGTTLLTPTATNLMSDNKYMMLIPQNASTCILIVDFTVNGIAQTTQNVAIGGTWTNGQSVNYTISVDRNRTLTCTMNVLPWNDSNIDGAIGAVPQPAPLYYGDANNNGNITTSLLGFTTTSYNSYREGQYQTEDVFANELPFYRLEVALEDEVNMMTWKQAMDACKNRSTNGTGWRLPRIAEVQLMYNNKSSLESVYGFTKFTSDSYWGATESGPDAGFTIEFTNGSFAGKAKTVPASVRCVREVPLLFVPFYYGDPNNNGAIVTDLYGATTSSYSYESADHYLTFSTADDVFKNDFPYAKLQVAPTNEINDANISWKDAKVICDGKMSDGGGWRLPRVSELRLMYNNYQTLNDIPGFERLGSSTYWSGTRYMDNYSWYFTANTAYSDYAQNTSQYKVRCVREVPMLPYVPLYYGDDANNGGSTTSLYGATAMSYNNEPADHYLTFPTGEEVLQNDPPYAKLQVATTNESISLTWNEAKMACKNKTTNGTDWRLPRVSELLLIMNNRLTLNAIADFQPIDANNAFWSGTQYDTDNCWYLGNSVTFGAKTLTFRVRCVREVPMLPYVPLYYGDDANNGGSTTNLYDSTTTSYNNEPADHYLNLPTGDEVFKNDLPYAKLEVAVADEKNENVSWDEAKTACDSKTTDGTGWRLPRLSELCLMYNNLAKLNTIIGFRPTSSRAYWSGTQHSDVQSWAFGLSTGVSWPQAKETQYRVRCVREVH